MQLALDSGELLTEEDFLLLFRWTFVNGGVDLPGRFKYGCLFEEDFGGEVWSGFCVWSAENR
jgi:hypothetical protein